MRSINVHVKESKMLIFTLILLMLNTFLLTIGINILKQDGQVVMNDLNTKKQFAEEIVEYNQRLAQKLNVDKRTKVKETLSRFHYEINLVSSSEELYKVIQANGRSVQETILREYENQQRDMVIALINSDPKIRNTYSKKNITISFDPESGVVVEPENSVEESTYQKISEIAYQGDIITRQSIEIEVAEGQAKLAVPHNPLDHITTLTSELDALRTILYETRVSAGFAELTGPGIIVKLYDAEDGHTSETIVHDSDIRDIVNELFIIGAQGIAIGDKRLIATSSIRCVGPTIQVNYQSVPVNPVVIKAVGDPESLESGLDIFNIIFNLYGGLRMEIEKVDNLTLPAYSN
ncbi:MAG: hypothetical protein CVU88_04285 [Firmicutes bacterium HGW-Firmicutes-13]|nr:MAG: hypothetical protein CVU88_04285 [Firmicutes bacterium HGW-Firmicutes-13]